MLHNQWHGCSLRGNVKSQGISSNAINLVLPAYSLQWHHNWRDSVSNHKPHDCFLNRLFRRRSKKTSKLRVIGLCAGNSPGTGEFPVQMASNAENVSIWWRHHAGFNTRWVRVLQLASLRNFYLFDVSCKLINYEGNGFLFIINSMLLLFSS